MFRKPRFLLGMENYVYIHELKKQTWYHWSNTRRALVIAAQKRKEKHQEEQNLRFLTCGFWNFSGCLQSVGSCPSSGRGVMIDFRESNAWTCNGDRLTAASLDRLYRLQLFTILMSPTIYSTLIWNCQKYSGFSANTLLFHGTSPEHNCLQTAKPWNNNQFIFHYAHRTVPVSDLNKLLEWHSWMIVIIPRQCGVWCSHPTICESLRSGSWHVLIKIWMTGSIRMKNTQYSIQPAVGFCLLLSEYLAIAFATVEET